MPKVFKKTTTIIIICGWVLRFGVYRNPKKKKISRIGIDRGIRKNCISIEIEEVKK